MKDRHLPPRRRQGPRRASGLATLALALGGLGGLCRRASAGAAYFGAYDSTPRTPEGHVDTRAIAAGLAQGHMNFYNYLVYGGDEDWDDLAGLLRETKGTDIRVIIDLIPPSEKPCSKPFCYDFQAWGRNIATLSLAFPHLIGFSIDDFTLNFPGQAGKPDPAIAQMMRDAKAVNPKLLFLPTVYGPHLARFSENYKGTADGLLLYTEFYDRAGALPDRAYWADNIASAKKDFAIVVSGIYAVGRGPAPPPEIPAAKARLAHDLGATGIMMYCLGWSGPTWDAVSALYGRWNHGSRSAASAGRRVRSALARLESRARRLAEAVAAELRGDEPDAPTVAR